MVIEDYGTEGNYVYLFRLLRKPTFNALNPFLKAVVAPADATGNCDLIDEVELDKLLYEALVKHDATIRASNFSPHESKILDQFKKDYFDEIVALSKGDADQGCRGKNLRKKFDVPLMTKLIISFSLLCINEPGEWWQELKKHEYENLHNLEDVFHSNWSKVKHLFKGKASLWDLKLFSEILETTVSDLICVFCPKSEETLFLEKIEKADLNELKEYLLRALENDSSFDKSETKRVELGEEYIDYQLNLVLPKYTKKIGGYDQKDQLGYEEFSKTIQEVKFLNDSSTGAQPGIRPYSRMELATIRKLIKFFADTSLKALAYRTSDREKLKEYLLKALENDSSFDKSETKRLELGEEYIDYQLNLVLPNYTKKIGGYDQKDAKGYEVFSKTIQEEKFLNNSSTGAQHPIMPYSRMELATIRKLIKFFGETSLKALAYRTSDREKLKEYLLKVLDTDHARKATNGIELGDAYVNQLLGVVLSKYIADCNANSETPVKRPWRINKENIVKMHYDLDDLIKILGPHFANEFLEKNRPSFVGVKDRYKNAYEDLSVGEEKPGKIEFKIEFDKLSPGSFLQCKNWFVGALLIDHFRKYRNHLYHIGEEGLEFQEFKAHRRIILHMLAKLGYDASTIEITPENQTDEDKRDLLIAVVLQTFRAWERKTKLVKKTKGNQLNSQRNESATNAAKSTGVMSVLKTFKKLGEKFNSDSKYQQALDVNTTVLLHYRGLYKASKTPENLCNVVDCLKNVAVSYWDLGNYREAEQKFSEAKTLMDDVVEAKPIKTSKARGKKASVPSMPKMTDQCLATTLSYLVDYASLFIDLGKYEEARKMLENAKGSEYEEARERLIERGSLEADHSRYWKLYVNSGNLHFHLEEYDEALAEYEEALKLVDKQSADYQYIRGNIACVKLKHKKITEALDEYRKILSDLDKMGDDTFNSSETIAVRYNQAVALFELGAYEEALELHNDVFEQRQMIYGMEHHTTMQSISDIGGALFELGSYDEALARHQEVYKWWCEVADETNAKAMIERACIARCYSKLGRCDEASNEFKEVIKDSTKVLGEDHPDTKKAKAYYREHLE